MGDEAVCWRELTHNPKGQFWRSWIWRHRSSIASVDNNIIRCLVGIRALGIRVWPVFVERNQGLLFNATRGDSSFIDKFDCSQVSLLCARTPARKLWAFNLRLLGVLIHLWFLEKEPSTGNGQYTAQWPSRNTAGMGDILFLIRNLYPRMHSLWWAAQRPQIGITRSPGNETCSQSTLIK